MDRYCCSAAAVANAGTETGSCDVSVIAKSDACLRGSEKNECVNVHNNNIIS